jgi:hypothetical protein
MNVNINFNFIRQYIRRLLITPPQSLRSPPRQFQNQYQHQLLRPHQFQVQQQRRNMSFTAASGALRYGCTKIVDYAGVSYIVPYSCSIYTDEIDGFINNVVCDIPAEDYHTSAHIIEAVVNQRLTRLYGCNFNLILMPPAKNMLPSCITIS